jgi:hypothetical protein
VDPWQIVAGLIAAMTTGIGILYRAVTRGDFVPGSIYRHQVEMTALERKGRELAEARADKAETQAERNTDALRAFTSTVKMTQRDQPGPSDG